MAGGFTNSAVWMEDLETANQMRLSELTRQWLSNARFRLKESSYVKYCNVVNNHILPELGDVLLPDFTTERLERFVADKLENGRLDGGGLSGKSVKDVLTVLKDICRYASVLNLPLLCQPSLVRIRSKDAQIQVLDPEEQQQLACFLLKDEDRIKTGILLSLYMGLRIGEVCALRHRNIHLDAGILCVRGTMQRLQNFSTEGKRTKVMITEPKSSSAIRDIPIPQFLLERLRTLTYKSEDAFLLTGMEDAWIEPRTLENRFRACQQELHMRRVNYHALRHTFATRCIESGCDPKSVSEILGHASVNITLNRYVHSSMELKRKSMERLADPAAGKEERPAERKAENPYIAAAGLSGESTAFSGVIPENGLLQGQCVSIGMRSEDRLSQGQGKPDHRMYVQKIPQNRGSLLLPNLV